MENISKHITFNAATRSNTAKLKGLSNTPPKRVIAIMKITAEAVFEPVRNFFNKPIFVSSFYRSPLVNKATGSTSGDNAGHPTGEAIDVDAQVLGGLTNAEIFWFIYYNLEFDQLIWEFGNDDEPDWVHVSYTQRKKNRKQVLKAVRVKGKPRYTAFNVNTHKPIKFQL